MKKSNTFNDNVVSLLDRDGDPYRTPGREVTEEDLAVTFTDPPVGVLRLSSICGHQLPRPILLGPGNAVVIMWDGQNMHVIGTGQ